MKLSYTRLLLLCLAGISPSTQAAVTFYTEPHYRQKSDSPFSGGLAGGLLFLEDFTDRLLDDIPHASLVYGSLSGGTDNVDIDDGTLDGRSIPVLPNVYSGGSWIGIGGPRSPGPYPFEIRYSPDSVNGLPRYAGLVGIESQSFVTWSIQAWDGAGNELTGGLLSHSTRIPGEPAMDFAFLGLYSDNGIAMLRVFGITAIDHIQYAWAIPEPSAGLLAGVAALPLLRRRRVR